MKTQPTYSMKQQLLYTVCEAGWTHCSEHIQKFTDFKPFYTPSFVTDQLKAVADAEALPNIRETVGDRKRARIELSNGTRLIMKDWQSLKAYIENAYPEDMIETMLEQAGASLYKKAQNKNWSGTRSLIDAAQKFIKENATDLSKNDNMPDSFPIKFQADSDDCLLLATTFADTDMEKEEDTNNKIDANNSIYAALVRLSKDAANIFKDEPAIKKQFTISYLVAVNGGEGSASLTGYIRDENKQPIKGAVVSSKVGKYGAVTDAKGRYRITRISASLYNFIISCPGYQPISQEVDFTPGTASRANFTLINMMEKVL